MKSVENTISFFRNSQKMNEARDFCRKMKTKKWATKHVSAEWAHFPAWQPQTLTFRTENHIQIRWFHIQSLLSWVIMQ